ncbi:hypothetical protein [Humisphaera borealis]|uniref:DUF5666 domain-containing protein n=1 Tax=Humisphaera borealis TaxID=2807512 RepID=A0A7M2WXK0_9BACT|nr:hypothetical protein [Humisphaera borealis]QOV90139.1 hypothetical protein IPV69_01835 [Humisphaera borealis]
MSSGMIRTFTAAVLMTALLLSGSASVLGQAKKPEPPKKPDPLVIKLESAQKGKHMGEDVLLVTGTEPLSGQKRVFAVENERPQNPKDPPKYAPNPRIKENLDKVKPGEFLKVEPKAPSGRWGGATYGNTSSSGGYGRNNNAPAPVEWLDKAEGYLISEHETEPGTFVFDGAFLDDLAVDGQKIEVYSIELIKLGRVFKCLAPMINDGKKMVPDPAIMAIGDELMKKEKGKEKKASKAVIEATINPQGDYLFVTSLDAYQAPRTGILNKLVDADIDGNKGQAIEVDEGGKTLTLVLPGKLVGKKWTTDFGMLAFAKKAKPGTPIVFKTRDTETKSYLRALELAPKEAVKKGSKETAGVETKK